jgi:hypothetical protein
MEPATPAAGFLFKQYPQLSFIKYKALNIETHPLPVGLAP